MTVTIVREGNRHVDNPTVNALSQALCQNLVEAVATLDTDKAT